MLQVLSNDEAIKVYKSMLIMHRMGFENSIRSMYLELIERGFDFSLWEDDVVELHKGDKTYKWLQVKFHLYLIKVDNLEKTRMKIKLLKKWSTTYVMTREEMFWDGFKEENVDTNDSTSDIGAMLETIGIKNKKIVYFINQV